jgi:hypothetical protein
LRRRRAARLGNGAGRKRGLAHVDRPFAAGVVELDHPVERFGGLARSINVFPARQRPPPISEDASQSPAPDGSSDGRTYHSVIPSMTPQAMATPSPIH